MLTFPSPPCFSEALPATQMAESSFSGDAWTPVQEIVRLNFKALHDVVKAHGEALKSVEKGVASKVGRHEFTSSLTEKVGVTELTTTFEELSRVIDDKADARDTSALVERMVGRSEVQAALAAKADVSEVQRCLDTKAGLSETNALIETLQASRCHLPAPHAQRQNALRPGRSSLLTDGLVMVHRRVARRRKCG